MKRLFVTVLAVFAVFLSGAVAYALDDSFTVSATVTGECTISADDLAFGSYLSNQSSNLAATSQITVNCSTGQAWSVALNSGLYHGDCGGYRCMSDGSSPYLFYNIYKEGAHLNQWLTGGEAVTGTGTGGAQDLTAYGKIDANQNVPPGSYSDTVTATVTW